MEMIVFRVIEKWSFAHVFVYTTDTHAAFPSPFSQLTCSHLFTHTHTRLVLFLSLILFLHLKYQMKDRSKTFESRWNDLIISSSTSQHDKSLRSGKTRRSQIGRPSVTVWIQFWHARFKNSCVLGASPNAMSRCYTCNDKNNNKKMI